MLRKIEEKIIFIILLFTSIVFFGCSVKNEGKVDLRRTNTSYSLIDDGNGDLVKYDNKIRQKQIDNLKKSYHPHYLFDINTSLLNKNIYNDIDAVYNDLNITDENLLSQVNFDLKENNESIKQYISDYIQHEKNYEKNKSKYYRNDAQYNAIGEKISLKIKDDNKSDHNLSALIQYYDTKTPQFFSEEEKENSQKSTFIEVSEKYIKKLENNNTTKKTIHIVKHTFEVSLYDLLQEQNITERLKSSEETLYDKEYKQKYKMEFFYNDKAKNIIKNAKQYLDIKNLLLHKAKDDNSSTIYNKYIKQLKDEYKTKIKNDLKKHLDIKPTQFQSLEMKNFSLGTDKETRFVVGDSLSLHLRSVYIADFSEIGSLHFNRQNGKAIGQIAIVANAFEKLDGHELSFENQQAGRVVFYSDDVNKEQFLNFNNMPIYGPLIYKGAPFAFRIAIFELDNASEQSKSMLNTIAQAGSTAYPPASPVLKILNSIGSSMLNGNQTDTEFRYTMILDPKGGSSKTNHFVLEVGNYVFVRMEDRTRNVNWDELVLNENEGKLYWKDRCAKSISMLVDSRSPKYNSTTQRVTFNSSDIKHLCDNNCSNKTTKRLEYTDGTYVVVEITKNISNIDVQLSQNSFKDLMTSLEEQDNDKAKNLKEIQNSLMYAAVKRVQIYNFNKAKKILADLEKPDKDIIPAQKKTDLKELFKMIANSVNANGSVNDINSSQLEKNNELSEDEIDYIMRKLRVMADSKKDVFSILTTKNIKEAIDEETNKNHNEELIELINLIVDN